MAQRSTEKSEHSPSSASVRYRTGIEPINERRSFPCSGNRLRNYLRRRRAPSSEPVIEEVSETKKRWDWTLPFLAHGVLDLDFELPKPYGFGSSTRPLSRIRICVT